MNSRLKILLYNKALNTFKQYSRFPKECNWLPLKPCKGISHLNIL